jgi:putative acetyltransferase
VEVLLLSPLSIATGMQGQGIGSLLVNDLLDLARAAQPEPAVFLEGPPAYYARFGFEAASRYGVWRPSLRIPEEALQVVWLRAWSDELSGTLVYPDPFWELDCVGLR